MSTTFRGKPACECQAAWIPKFEAMLQAQGIISGPLTIYQLIGGAAASGGTHTKGGASDFEPLHPDGVQLARDMGADATWFRPVNWDGKGGGAHVHSVLTGCPHNGPAAYQIDAVRAGFNGLGHLGRGAPDPGPRPLSGRTWQQGIAWADQQMTQEDDMAWSDQLVKWWPGKTGAKQTAPAGQQLNQARGYAQEAYASARRCEAAIGALAKAMGPTVEKAVEAALADATVKVSVSVAGGGDQ